MHARALGVAWLLGAGAAQLVYADDLVFQAQRTGDAVEMRASVTMRVDPLRAWRVLTSYERYSEFIPDVASSRVLSREGDRVVLEQRGRARFLWMSQPMLARLEVVETPPTLVESRLLSGTVRELRGRYELATVGNAVRLVYIGRVVPDDDHIGLLDLVAIRTHASRQFRALVREIERLAANGTEQTR